MSFEGFRGNGMNAAQTNTNTNNGVVSADKRDAWNRPIKEPVENKNDTTNNTVIDDNMIDNLWSDVQTKKPDENNQQTNNNQQQNNQQQQVQVAPAEQLKNYLNENGLGEFTLSDADKAQLAEGNYDVITSKTLQLVQNAHTKALSGASTLIKAEVAKAVKDAVSESKSYVEGKASLEALHSAIPATRDPAIGPVAQTVMQRLLDRGATKEQSIEGVKKWFKYSAGKMGYSPEVNSNRNGNYQGGQQQEGSGSQDWIKVLSGTS